MPSLGQKIFDAESEGLYDFVSKNGRGLYIPPYQRDYAWDKTNVERLIDDTIQGLNALLKRPEESITFIGTIIAMNDSKKSTINPLVKNQVYTQVMSIIDGQQRLTTLLMLCLALLLEIEVQWAELKGLKKVEEQASEEALQWLETRVNDMRGLLSQMLSERQNNGEGEFRHFPKMIRAFVDTWSYEADKAMYESPISWLLFEFVRFREIENANWTKFPAVLKETADASANEGQRKHFIKMLRVMRDKLRNLPDDDEFPELLGIVQDKEKQDTLFGEEFPESMKSALEDILTSSKETVIDGIKPNPEDARSKKWWEASTNLISLLFFAKFALERITLVVVTATTEDFAFDVFEALNTTGQPLTALETFVPKVVQSVGMSKYNASEEKKQLEIAGDYIRQVNRADERQKRSAELLVAFALAELGEKRSKNLAEQRRFMREKFDAHNGNRKQQQEFIRHLAELSRFFDTVWVNGSKKPTVDGMPLPDPASLCLRFLVDFGHTITAPLLAQYAAEVGFQKDPIERNKALKTFGEIIQAVTAFTVLWRASRSTTDRIDEVYRSLMAEGSPEHGVPALARGKRGNESLPDVNSIQAALAARLKAPRLQGDGKLKKYGANIAGKSEWIEKTISQPLWEINVTLARFVLLLAFHDVVEGSDGHLTRGKVGSNPTLSLDAWIGEQFSSVEHIAPRTKSIGWAHDLYGDDEYERLGNLTLVPTRCNSSLGNRSWEQKRSLFAALSAKTESEAQLILKNLEESGVDISEIGNTLYAGQYLPHVHTIGNVKGDWNLDAVNARGRELAELVWQRIAPWVGMT